MTYLTYDQIQEMAGEALTAYDFTGSWIRAKRAAWEHCSDEFGITATPAQIGLAVKLARVEWNEIVLQCKREIENAEQGKQ